MADVDLRLVSVVIEVNGQLTRYSQPLNISATGTRYGNANQNEAEIKISNLKQQTRDFILTETSPFNPNKTPKKIYLYAGRQSTGESLIFFGNVVRAAQSQPSDITLSLKCLSENYEKGNVIANTFPYNSQLSEISQKVATDIGASLNFQATEKTIANFNFSGGALDQVRKLAEMGEIDAYVDNGVLVVKDSRIPLSNITTIVNKNTGMIGQPEITEQGIKVKFLIDGQTTVGGSLQLTSELNPAVNGTYVVYKLGFEINSREEPFYWIAEGIRR